MFLPRATPWRSGMFFDSHAWGFGFNPGGASNSLPLWENNSCFFFFFFWGGDKLLRFWVTSPRIRKKYVFYFLSKFLIGEVFFPTKPIHSTLTDILWNEIYLLVKKCTQHNSHHPETCDASSFWTSAVDETDVLMFFRSIFTGPKTRNLFSISLSVLIGTALKDMRGWKFFTSGLGCRNLLSQKAIFKSMFFHTSFQVSKNMSWKVFDQNGLKCTQFLSKAVATHTLFLLALANRHPQSCFATEVEGGCTL